MFSIFGIAFFAVFVALALAIFVTRKAPLTPGELVPPEEDAEKDPEAPKLTLSQLFLLADRLVQENHLKIKDKIEISPTEVYWVAESSNDFFFGNYVLGFLEVTPKQPYATLSNILEFKDFIKSVTSTKGLYFTTGYFTRDVHQPLEGPKVSLYNRRKILEEFKRFNLKWQSEK